MNKICKNFQGMSLVEVIVAIGIFSVCMAGLSLFLVNTWKYNSYIYETGQDSLIASRAVNLVVKDLRKIKQADNGDYPVRSASDFDLTVFVDIDEDGDAEKVHYFVDQNSNELRMGVSEPSSSNPPAYSSGDDSVEILASHIVNDSDQVVFSYFGNNYLSNQTPFAVPVDSGEIINIKLIKVNLLVDIRPYQSPDHVTVESFVQLRNL
jgi:prepilin-type N-terminal cleavage/methylation domain-containing protein